MGRGLENSFAIRLEKVRKVYRVGQIITWALRGVDLEVERGEFVAIMGPSGSGKTTLLNMIGLLDRPTAGEVYIDGYPASRLSSKEMARFRNMKIGFVFQTFNLVGRLNVFENVELPLIPRGLPRRVRAKLVRDAILRVGGELTWLPKKPTQLSGGQQQRVAIARAIVTNPTIILADEPTGNLDRASAKQVLQTFIDLNEGGQTIVVVTHDPEVANCAERVLIIRDGRIVGEEVPNPARCIVRTVE